MFIPDYLYFEPKRISVQHTTQFTGNLDVPSAMGGDPRCWIKEDIGGVKHKKTLVLSDFKFAAFSYSQTESDKIRRIKHFIDELIQEGFSVYLWQDTGLIQLDEKTSGLLLSDVVQNHCTPVHPHEITHQMAKKNISAEAIEILDMHALEHLKKETQENKTLEKKPSRVTVQECEKVSFSLEDILQAYPELKQVEVDQSSFNFASLCQDWLKEHSNFPLLVNYQEMQLITDEDLMRYYENAHDVKRLKINFQKTVSVSLKKILDQGKNLDTITLNAAHVYDVDENSGPYNSIKTLDLSQVTNLEREDIQRLIQRLPGIQSIIVRDESCLKQITKVAPFNNKKSLFRVKPSFIEIRRNAIKTFDSIEKMAESVNTLKEADKLNLVTLVNLEMPIDTSAPAMLKSIVTSVEQFSSLEKVSFNSSFSGKTVPENCKLPKIRELVLGENASGINGLLHIFPNLEDLNIRDINVLGDSVIPKIAQLTLANWSDDSIDALALNVPNINDLKIDISQSILRKNINIVQKKPPELKKLRSIDLNNTGESPADFGAFVSLFKASSSVEKIYLSGGWNFPHERQNSLTNLRTFAYSPSDSKKNWLFPVAAILMNSPHLENLSLGAVRIEKGNLPDKLNLKSIRIVTPKDPDMIAEILKRSPKLEKLELNYFYFGLSGVIESLYDANITLPHLRSVSIEQAQTFSFSDYLKLRKIAPNLKSINITGVSCAEDLAKDISEKDTTGVRIINFDNRGATSVSSNSHQAEGSVDFDTIHKEMTYNTTRVFSSVNGYIHPHVMHYRNSTFNQIEFLKDQAHPFRLRNEGDLSLDSYKNYCYGSQDFNRQLNEAKQKKSNTFLGQFTMNLSTTFQPLPSLDPREVLTALNINGVSKDQIEVKYSQRDNQYYIRLKEGKSQYVCIDYLVDISEPPRLKNKELQDFVNSFHSFHSGKIDLRKSPESMSPQEIVEKMYEQQLGACRHRAVAFKHIAKQKFPDLQVRIVTNDVHAFVEVLEDNKWVRCDLGGYEATVNALPPANNLLQQQSISPQKTSSTAPLVTPAAPISAKSQYITWEMPNITNTTPDAVALQALSSVKIDANTGQLQGQNVLITCESDSDVQAMALTLQSMAKHTKRPVYVINNAHDIVCKSRWLKRESDNSGTSMEGPGGPLHGFLTQPFSDEEKPIIIVNWNNFSADEMVRFNSLIDAERSADGTPLPANMMVVGVYNTQKPNAYKGSDFYSRNPVKLKINDSKQELTGRFALQVKEDKPATDCVSIELYNSIHWKEILLGKWTLEAGKLRFVEGELVKALKQGRSIHLSNAPWELPDFQQFWQEAKIHGKIDAKGEKLNIPEGLWETITQSQGYNWQLFANDISFETDPAQLKSPFVLNQNSYTQLLPHYDIKEDLPHPAKSLFAQYTNQKMDLVLTESLSAPFLHQLLNEAQKWKVKLHIAVAPDVTLPKALTEITPVKFLSQKITPNNHVSLIESSDVSFSLAKLKKEMTDAPIVIDVTEFDNTDIFYNVTTKIEENKPLRFEERYSDIWQALRNKKTVILKGHFNNDLINECMRVSVEGGLMVNGQMQPNAGQLILLSDAPLSSAVKSEYVNPSLEEKMNWVLQNTPNLSTQTVEAIKKHSWPSDISLAQMQSAINRYRYGQPPPSFDIYEGIFTLTKPASPNVSFDLSKANVDKVCSDFVNKRMGLLKNILTYSPFAFVGGQTGVGKSTFMKRYLTPENGFSLYNEMQGLASWAEDKDPNTIKILFLDEANISDKDYTMFEGLYENPPSILINGKLVVLTDKHKVVLAGNPLSYGGERHLPALLAQRGNGCTFEAIPVEYIYRDILKPIFDASGQTEQNIEKFSQCILDTYRYICSLSEEEIYITPRELKMMAMMIITSSHQGKDYQHIVHEIAKQCLPADKKKTFDDWFSSSYSIQSFPTIKNNAIKPVEHQFILTPSREPIYQSLERLLAVRDKNIDSVSPALQSSGLGGMLLEGEPGTGKSHFIVDALLQKGYQKLPLSDKMQSSDTLKKGFYVLPASLSFQEKKRFLIKAFNEGVPVVIDEINSGPMLEQLINALLMGEDPETKKGPDRPGFLLLATQNPISMAGREATSKAVAKRLLFYEFLPYSRQEMETIFTETFTAMPLEKIQQHIQGHLDAVYYAKRHHLEPAPVFRDLYNIVVLENKMLESKKMKQHTQQETIENKENIDPNATSRQRNAFLPLREGMEKSAPATRLTQEIGKEVSVEENKTFGKKNI